ncbi:MAG TPA: ABC transporter ATP-binding protein [Candidatus Eremiobacteraeota bacterium]|nr:MAG: putative ABC transporter ATP-binding protein YxlF [bacterium ADurb.Bin363]HPZ09786.1 ABC transporter ATP-binding protein [Candidatus Eremiobacteraeota bacterium]
MEEECQEIINVTDLTKTFQSQTVVKGITFSLYPGDVFGLIGPNGAGKTTTLRILATVLKKDSGDVKIDNVPLTYTAPYDNLRKIRQLVGFMPDFLGLYDDLLVKEYLDFFARAFFIDESLRPFVIDEALETAGITELKEKEIEKLSRGMKQRLLLARVLIHNPKILLLDEPAAGLDPRARVELRDIIKDLRKKGKTIIISSHILEDIEDFCNRIGIIAKGCLIKFQDKEMLTKETINYVLYRISLLDKKEEARTFLSSQKQVKNLIWDNEDLSFEFHGSDNEASQLLKDLINQDFNIVSYSKGKPNLENVYMKYTYIKSA